MEQYVNKNTPYMVEYLNLLKKYEAMRMQYGFLVGIESVQKGNEAIEIYKAGIKQLEEKRNNADQESPKIEKDLEILNQNINVLYEALNILVQIAGLREKLMQGATEQAISKRNEIIEELLSQISNVDKISTNGLIMLIDKICIFIYRVPLLVALITKDPEEIKNDFKRYSLPEDLEYRIVRYIDSKKEEISTNLLLSDKALVDLVENVTGRNIVDQQRHNEIKYTGYNKRFDGQVLSEQNGYTLLYNQGRGGNFKATSGNNIKKFNEFNRVNKDMLVRDFPGVVPEEVNFQSFESLDSSHQRDLIRVVISNLELCYNMIKSLYFSDNVEVPIFINLTNGQKLQSKMEIENIPHLLGIRPAYSYNKDGNMYPNYPLETLRKLHLKKGNNALEVLDSIINFKDDIIEECGLNEETSTQTFYEMLPWETIILKTNAFIRGDFFKSTALISPVNPNSYLNYKGDGIKRVSITPTSFAGSAINQKLINPNLSFDETARILRKYNSPSDFVVKGMVYNNGLWVPKTNASAMGERIKPRNGSNLQTLEKYRYLISGIPSGPAGDDGGFIASAESPANGGIRASYSATEMLNALLKMSASFGSIEDIQRHLSGYLDQIEQAYMDEQENENDNDMGLEPGGLKR